MRRKNVKETEVYCKEEHKEEGRFGTWHEVKGKGKKQRTRAVLQEENWRKQLDGRDKAREKS